MKSLVSAVVVASALAVPALAFAQQSNGPVTRAQVRAELVAAEKDGTLYLGNSDYPGAAPQTVASQSGARTPTIEQRIFSTFRGN